MVSAMDLELARACGRVGEHASGHGELEPGINLAPWSQWTPALHLRCRLVLPDTVRALLHRITLLPRLLDLQVPLPLSPVPLPPALQPGSLFLTSYLMNHAYLRFFFGILVV